MCYATNNPNPTKPVYTEVLVLERATRKTMPDKGWFASFFECYAYFNNKGMTLLSYTVIY